MVELGAREEDVTQRMDFDQAGANFYTAAREGLGAHFTWLDGEDVDGARRSCSTSCCRSRRPGCARQGIADDDVKQYLGVVDAARAHGADRRALAAVVVERAEATGRRRASARTRWSRRRCSASRPGGRCAEWERARLDEAEASRAQLPARRAVHDDGPVHGARGRPGRDGREPDELGAHPPRARRGQRPPARRRSSRIARVLRFIMAAAARAARRAGRRTIMKTRRRRRWRRTRRRSTRSV